jgi:peroxisomal 3,2-trans-enoyl-CoA isomerase
MYKEIATALRELSASADPNASAIVLTGDGDYYSSGNDLSNFSKLRHPKAMAREAKNVCHDFVDAFVSCKKPIVCAVNGPAIGIAVTTMGLCDVRIARPHATFHTPFKRLGQAPEGCSSFLFPRLLGEHLAKEMLDGGKQMTAAEALQCGFISEVVDDPRDIVAVAAEIARQPTLQRFVTKENLLHKLKAVNADEVNILEKAWVSPECLNAIADFLASRNKIGPATAIRAVNRLRLFWDR